MENELMLKIENVSKIYKLGEIGGTTLRETLQRARAKLLKKEDPTKKVGAKNYNKGEKFKALDNVSFEVKKGERVGIIGHNGAGKSTLLKLISRVTGPSSGTIYMNGRVASMLEVGTGFHPELTGRENVYMNGAILGMTKKEIDAKMEDIIEFSEVRQFIDTPVKRYSSGMYVKLAFSVAAHLDSEIMIMDEVLAVGDMAFQNKCISKMNSVSKQEHRTILYVSHNMNTIRQLCDRVIVLKQGKVIYDGDVEEGIKYYYSENNDIFPVYYDYTIVKREYEFGKFARLLDFTFDNKEEAIYDGTNIIFATVRAVSLIQLDRALLRLSIRTESGITLGTSFTKEFKLNCNDIRTIRLKIDFSFLNDGKYIFQVMLDAIDNNNNLTEYDNPFVKMIVQIQNNRTHSFRWESKYYGDISLPPINIE